MNLILRMFLTIFFAKRASPVEPLDLSSVSMQVWPNDLDVQMHMNNGRFLSLMDLGRIDFMVRIGFWREARQRGWFPLVGTTKIDYRRPLKVFERYDLTTRVIGWDERWFFMEQQFIAQNKVMASAILKVMLRSSEGLVTPLQAMEAIRFTGSSPELPAAAKALL